MHFTSFHVMVHVRWIIICLALLPLLTIQIVRARLQYLSIDPNAAMAISVLQLGNNSELTGSLPPSLFNASSSLATINCDATRLSGRMPNIDLNDAPKLQYVDLRGTDIEFCYAGKTNWTASAALTSGLCFLDNSTAYFCSDSYPDLCGVSAPSPRASTVGCSDVTKPSDDFICRNGNWISTGSVTVPVLTIPSGASQTVIVDNLTTSSVIINGLGSTLVLEMGCPINMTSIGIRLTPEDLKQTGSRNFNQTLLISDSDCQTLDNITIIASIQDGSSCRKLTTKKTVSSRICSLFSRSIIMWWHKSLDYYHLCHHSHRGHGNRRHPRLCIRPEMP